MVITAASDLVFKTVTSGTYGKIFFEAILKTIFKKKVIKKVLNKKKKNFIRNLKGVLPISQIAKVANVSQEKVKKILMM